MKSNKQCLSWYRVIFFSRSKFFLSVYKYNPHHHISSPLGTFVCVCVFVEGNVSHSHKQGPQQANACDPIKKDSQVLPSFNKHTHTHTHCLSEGMESMESFLPVWDMLNNTCH